MVFARALLVALPECEVTDKIADTLNAKALVPKAKQANLTGEVVAQIENEIICLACFGILQFSTC